MITGEIFPAPVGAVGAGSVQFTAQHSFARKVVGELSNASAALQQLAISEFVSPACVGTPASTLPAMVTNSTNDVSHFAIGSYVIRASEALSR
jgi:hypothetical protein